LRIGFVIFAEAASVPPKLAGWIVLFAMMLALVAAGAWLGLTSAMGLLTAYRSHAWDAIPCVVTSSSMAPARRSVPNLTWAVKAMCTYEKGGEDHSVNCSPHAVGSRDLAQSQYASLQINSVHMCYVNPKNFSDALYGEDQNFLLPLLFFVSGATFIVLGAAGAKFLIRNGTS
jgi:hypothetical protein